MVMIPFHISDWTIQYLGLLYQVHLYICSRNGGVSLYLIGWQKLDRGQKACVLSCVLGVVLVVKGDELFVSLTAYELGSGRLRKQC